MKFRKIGSSDLEVSSVCLGTWVFGGFMWGGANDNESKGAVGEAIEKGINFIDTAPIYGDGRSEEVIGKAIAGRRDNLIIATKCGLQKKGRNIEANLSASFIREEIENSLKRLGVDMIDLYQCHWPDENTPYEETFGELNKLASEGKIRYIGVSNFSGSQTEKALEVSPIVSNQVHYSLFERKIEDDLFPLCNDRGVSILSYGSLGGGILTGKYSEPKKFPKSDARNFFYTYYEEPFWSKARELVKTLEEIASKRGVATSQVAINWVLSHKEVASCIAGSRTPGQLDQNAASGTWQLSEEELSRIEEEYKRIF